MTKAEILRAVESLGGTGPVLNYVVYSGQLGKVKFDERGNRIFTPEHLAKFVTYLSCPRRRGRPPRQTTTQRQGGKR